MGLTVTGKCGLPTLANLLECEWRISQLARSCDFKAMQLGEGSSGVGGYRVRGERAHILAAVAVAVGRKWRS